jgi:ferredoxin
VQQGRSKAQEKLALINGQWPDGVQFRDCLERGYDSQIFEEQGLLCVECQACTRICPTCHCFYLYEAAAERYFLRMKM